MAGNMDFEMAGNMDLEMAGNMDFEMAGNMGSELLLKFIGYFPDYLSALWRTL